MYENIFNTLRDRAIENVNHPWAKVSAAVVSKGYVIGYGVNRNKSHPFQLKYSKNPESIFLHAEISAIHDALNDRHPDDISGHDLYVCRIKTIGKKLVYGLAKPCIGCMKAIVEFDIRRVYYTTDEGLIEQL